MDEHEKIVRHGERRREDQALAADVRDSVERDERYQQLVELAPGVAVEEMVRKTGAPVDTSALR